MRSINRYLLFALFGLVIASSNVAAFQYQIRIGIKLIGVSKLGEVISLDSSFGLALNTKARLCQMQCKEKLRLSFNILKSALQTQSNFESKLFDLTEIEAVWETSLEFNEIAFEEL